MKVYSAVIFFEIIQTISNEPVLPRWELVGFIVDGNNIRMNIWHLLVALAIIIRAKTLVSTTMLKSRNSCKGKQSDRPRLDIERESVEVKIM